MTLRYPEGCWSWTANEHVLLSPLKHICYCENRSRNDIQERKSHIFNCRTLTWSTGYYILGNSFTSISDTQEKIFLNHSLIFSIVMARGQVNLWGSVDVLCRQIHIQTRTFISPLKKPLKVTRQHFNISCLAHTYMLVTFKASSSQIYLLKYLLFEKSND